jgi:hypothetical protein
MKVSGTLMIGDTISVPAKFKVAVAGNIIATGMDLKIPEKWPDYVFTNDHHRLSLEELSEFIEKNGHLPAVPSAREMMQNRNYNVADMDVKLLEKIEELALYIIELEKEIETQK